MQETTADIARQFAETTAQKRELQDVLKTTQAALDEIESRLIAALVEDGIAKVTVETDHDGKWTISASTLAWARLKEGAAGDGLVEILRANGLVELLTINSTKLSGMYRDHVALMQYGSEILPAQFVEMIEVSERTKISARKA